MEYSIKKVSDLTGVSTRTLRYYDEIELLKPCRIASNGYRIYGQNELDLLYQILLYRSLEMNLDDIKKILMHPDFDQFKALKEHKNNLLAKAEEIDKLIKNVDLTIENIERGVIMDNDKKFEAFKKNLVEENEKKYGDEIREKYGESTIKESNKKFMDMSESDFEEMQNIGNEILIKLKEAYKTNDPSSALAQEVCALHKKWLGFTWGTYSKEAHLGLAQMYVDDERFKAYYDKEQDGLAEFLRDSMAIFCR